MLIGALLITIALMPASYVGLSLLLALWLVAGVGQTLVNVSAQTLIADRTPTELQGRVYGAQFAWSHLWWVFSYPLAGWLGSYQQETPFLYGSLMGLVLLVIVQLTLSPRGQQHDHQSYWHEHEHIHDDSHQHDHHPGMLAAELHTHSHQHGAIQHAHVFSETEHFHKHG
jgi:MFS transporter, NRE family, putaive nickel resistance protein